MTGDMREDLNYLFVIWECTLSKGQIAALNKIGFSAGGCSVSFE